MILRGILDRSLSSQICIRGFAPIKELANNRNKDAEKVYNEIIKERLTNKLVDSIMNKAPEKYGEIMNENVLSYINRTAYNVLRNVANAA